MTDTINIPRAELQAALDALQECRQKIAYLLGNIEWYESAQAIDFADISIKAISARFAQPEKEQEPVAWGVMKRGERVYYVNDSRNVCQGYAELYVHRSGYGAGTL